MVATFYRFANRTEAGKRLADALSGYTGRSDILILALPRGGVPVAYEVAKALSATMDLWLVRKLGVPGHEELALGALAGKNIRIFNQDIIDLLHIDETVIDGIVARELAELGRRNTLYRQGKSPPSTEQSLLSMTAWLRVRPCVLRLHPSVRRARHGSSWLFRLVRHPPAAKSVKKRMSLYACTRRSLFTVLDNGIAIFPRPRMRTCWRF